VSLLVPWIADALVVSGLLVLTAAVVGMVRMGRFGVRIHAAGKAAFLGLVPLLLAAMTTGEGAMVARAGLVLAFLILTTPVAAHALARAVYRHQARRNRQRRPASGDRP